MRDTAQTNEMTLAVEQRSTASVIFVECVENVGQNPGIFEDSGILRWRCQRFLIRQIEIDLIGGVGVDNRNQTRCLSITVFLRER